MMLTDSGRLTARRWMTALFVATAWFSAHAVEDAFLVRDIFTGTGNSSNPTGLTVMGSYVYFSAASATGNTELWRSDATNAGTVLVQEIRAGATGSAPTGFVTNGTFLFFEANDGTNGIDGYVSNGSVGNATLLNIRAGGTDANILNQTPAGTKVYFTANNGTTGQELYVTDGTLVGTLNPKDLYTGAGNSSNPGLLTAIGNSVIFEATDGSSGIEPYVSDGTNAGTLRLADIRGGANSSDPSSMKHVAALGLVFFDANAAGTIGRELYKTDGTSGGTALVRNINSGANNGNPINLSSALGKLFFSADGGGNGIEPYVSDGTSGGTFELMNINGGGGDSNPYGFTEAGTLVYFGADGSSGIELYKTDGTTGGTALVENIRTGGTGDSSPANLTAFGNLLFFSADDGSGQEPWISDGTTGGTFELLDVRPGGTGSAPADVVVTTDFVYFTADDGSDGREWWRTDGTTAGTIQVHDIRAGGTGANILTPVKLGNYVVFSASNGTTAGLTAQELWGIETVHPSVTSIVRASADPTGAATVDFTVTFSEGVTGVNAADFAITAVGLSGTSIASVTQVTTSTYTVTVNTGTGAGTLRLDVTDNDSVVDLGPSANPIGGEGANNGNYTAGEVYTVDRQAPSVSSIARAGSDPTNASSVGFTVTFNENVTGVDTGDFSLTVTGVTGASVTSVTPVSASVYTVAVNTGSGSGTVRLDVTDNDTILDSFSNRLGGTGAGNGNFTTGQVYTIDKTAPPVSSINRASANPTAAASVNFTVTFGETVTGVNTSDFALTVTGVTGASVASVTPVSGTVYTVAVNTGSGSGTIRLDIADDDSIADSAGNPLGGAGAGNGNYTAGQTYTVDKSPPSVVSIVRVGASPTNAASVSYTVTFDENVTGVNNADFVLTTSGVSGTSVTSTTQVTPSTYTVVVNTGSGSGTIRLDVADNDSIIDTLGTPLGGAGNGNGNFTSGEVYTIDKTAPSVSSIVRVNASPTNASTVQYTVTFDENVTGVNNGDFTLTVSGVTGASVTGTTQVTPSTYTVTVGTGTGSGTVRLDFVDNNSVTDSVGNATAAGFTTGEVYTIDRTGPTVSSIDRSGSNPTNAASLAYLATFSENVTGVDSADFSLTLTGGVAGASIASVTQVTASTYTVTVNSGSGEGTIRVNFIDNDTVLDTLGNVAGGAGAGNANFTTGQTYTIDRTAPSVSSINRASANPTAAASVNFTVTFGETVTGVNTGDFTLNVSGLTGTSVTSVTPVSGTVYTVAVNTGSGSGTLRLDVADDDSIADAAGNLLGGTGAGNGNYTAGQSYTVDKQPPAVSSIVRAGTNPTNGTTVSYTVTFSENVTGVSNGDFSLTVSGVTGTSIASTTQVTPSTYTVVVNTGSNSGTIRLDLIDNDSILDTLGNRLGGTGNGNGNFTTGEVYTIDKTAPAVSSINRADSNPTNAATVNFTVTFSENVTGVNNGDFTLSVSGVAGASVTGTTQVTASTYTVAVATGTGSGTIRLDFVDNNSVIDTAGNPTAAGFTTGQSYTIDRTGPTVSSINRIDASPTNSATVSYQVTFSENATGVDASDFAVTMGGGVTGATVGTVTQNTASTYTVAVNTGTGSGTLRLDFDDNDTVIDSFGNPAGGAGVGNGDYTGGQSYTMDRTGPAVSSSIRLSANPTTASSVTYWVTFNENINSVDTGDFTLTTTGTISGASVSSVTQIIFSTLWLITVNTGTGSGTLRLDFADNDSVTDLLGNPTGGPGNGNGDYTSGEVYTIDRTPPAVSSIVRADGDPTNNASVSFTVTFTENVTGVGTADFALTTSGVTGTSITSVTQVTPDVYTVAVNAGSGSGTVRLDVVDDDTIRDTVANRLGGTGNGNGNFTSGQFYTIDRVAPTVSSINRTGGNPSNAASIQFTATFSEAVTGVDTGDFTLATTGVTGASVSSVTPVSQTTYTVTVNTGSGSGTIRLNLTDDDSVRDLATNRLGGTGAGNGNFTGQQYTIDKAVPTVSSITRASANPANAASVGFLVTFSEDVSGVNTADFALAATGGVTGESIASVTQNTASTYTVLANTGSGDGTLRLDFVDDDSVIDTAANPAGGTGVGNGNFTTGEVYTIDKTAPTVLSIVRAGTNPSNAASVSFTVTFSEDVTGVNAADFGVLATGGVTGASVGTVTPVTAAQYTVAVNTGTGDGTVRLDLADDDTIKDSANNALGGTGAGNGNFATGETYTIDKTPPTVVSIVRAGANPTNAASVQFTVTFTENVTGVNASDFALTTTGGTTGASVTSRTQVTPSQYTVTVNTGTGDGTIRLDLDDNDSIEDSANNALGGTGVGNGSFTTGEVYTVDKTVPSVVSVVRVDTSPTNAASVQYDVTYSEDVTGVDSGDFTLTTTGVSGAAVSGVVQTSASLYRVTVDTGSGDGTVRLDVIDDDTVVDGAANALGGTGAGNGGFMTGDVYAVDKSVPVVTSIVRADTNPTTASSVNFTVTFSEDVTGVGVGDFDLTATGVTGASIASRTQVSASVYTVTVNTGTGDGTIRLDLDDNDSIIDGANNPLGGTGAGNGSFATGEVYTVDRTAPQAVSIVRADVNPTSAATVHFTVTFSENVTGVNAGDFDLTVTGGVTGASVVSRSQVTPSVYTVTVNTGTGDGTIRLDLDDNDSIKDSAGNALGGAGVDNGDYTAGEAYTVDKTLPSVVSVVRVDASPTSAASVQYDVTFSEDVTGVDADDFRITAVNISGASVTGVAQTSASLYRVTVGTGTGDGTVRLDVADDDTIVDGATSALGGVGTGNGDFTTGDVYTVDKSMPSVVSIVRAGANPTTASSVNFTVTFSESVTGVNVADFVLTATGVTGASITGRTQVTPSTYTVAVNTGAGTGTVRLDVSDNDSIKDLFNNSLGGAGTGNGDFTAGEVYTIDRTPPAVASVTRAGSNPTNASSVGFTVTFTEAVTGVNAGDFALTTTGGVAGASITNVALVSSGVYAVAVNTGSGDGTIRLDVVDDDSIADAASQPLGGAGAGNGNFTAGEVYTIDRVIPNVVSIVRLDPSPTNAISVRFAVTFTKNVVGVDDADFVATAAGMTGTSISYVQAVSPTTFHVTVNSGTGNGTIRLDLIDNDTITDTASNPLGGAGAGNGDFTTGEVYTLDTAAPVVTGIVRTSPNPTALAFVTYTVTFSENVTGVNVPDFALTTSGVTGASISGRTQVNPSTYTVTVLTGTGSGTVRLDVVDDDSIADAIGNRLGGTGAGNGNVAGEVYTIDRTPPSVVSVKTANLNPTALAAINFTVTFSEPVTGVNASDFSLTSAGVTGASIDPAVIQVSPSVYTVKVNTGTGDGSIRLDVRDNDSIRDALSQPLGGDGDDNGDFETGETYLVVKSKPLVNAIARVSASPTAASQVTYSVHFTKSVTGVGADDFALEVSGPAGASVGAVTEVQGDEYHVVVNTGSGDGTIKLLLVDNDTIADGGGVKLGGTGLGNGNYSLGDTFVIDRTAPALSIGAPSAATTFTGPVIYTVTFTGADTVSLTPGMVTLNTTGSATGTVTVDGTGSAQRTVTISGISGPGTIGISIAAGAAQDTAGNASAAAGPSATFEVEDAASLPVQPWLVAIALAVVAAAWMSLRRRPLA